MLSRNKLTRITTDRVKHTSVKFHESSQTLVSISSIINITYQYNIIDDKLS
jgi:hypothetical protein